MPVNPNYVPASGDGAHYNDDGSFTYPDGTVATLEEINTARSEKGLPPLGSGKYAGQDQAAGNWEDNNSPQHDVAKFLGIEHSSLIPGAPNSGTSLDTSAGDEDRARLNPLQEQLQKQASTGSGPWEQQLAKATGQASSAAQALGQSTPGQGYASELHNIGNAQSAIGQRAVGQGNILRAQAKQTGQTQLSDLLAGLGGQDAGQAADSAAALQSTREANNAAAQAGSKTLGNTAGAAGQFIMHMLSDGGKVPGKPEVFGDDEKNDTVPAWLSPGELVIPRSHAGSPEAAAEFVRALHASRGVRHFADGGSTAWNENPANATGRTGLETQGSNLVGPGPQAGSLENGAFLNTTAYDANRKAALANSDLLAKSAAGSGPSTAPQLLQNSSDNNIAAALQAMSGQRGMPAGDVLQETGAAQQGAAGHSAAATAGETKEGQTALMHAILGQRARDQALALAKQQAAFRNSEMNLGLDLSQMSAVRNIVGATGQGLEAYSSAASKTPDFSGSDKNLPSFEQGFGSGGSQAGSQPGEWSNPYAHGGEVTEDEETRTHEFLAALRRRKAA